MKRYAKVVARGLALIAVLPAVIAYQTLAFFCAKGKAFSAWSQLFSLIPGTTGSYLRWAFYRCVLARCDSDAWIGFGTTISHPTAEIGCTVYIGTSCSLGDVTLEDDVIVSSHVSIMNGSRQHGVDRLDIPIREQPGIWPRVTIGRDTWIGERAIVQVDVGKHCVVGAGSVVTRPVPDYAVVVGVPAKVLRFRNQGADGLGEHHLQQPDPPSTVEHFDGA